MQERAAGPGGRPTPTVRPRKGQSERLFWAGRALTRLPGAAAAAPLRGAPDRGVLLLRRSGHQTLGFIVAVFVFLQSALPGNEPAWTALCWPSRTVL